MKTKVFIGPKLNALVWQEGNLFVAKTVEIDIASQGKTIKEALSNLQEAVSLYLEDEKLPHNQLPQLTNLELHKITAQYA